MQILNTQSDAYQFSAYVHASELICTCSSSLDICAVDDRAPYIIVDVDVRFKDFVELSEYADGLWEHKK